ncbi:STAS domain-containing protein [Streptomyces sp. NRRL F-5755]|uniref:STAS domain-containing protein n=1 Tax=Streptomyces sp. NRRL F-5755 TaxID=1519475 RepID=UPI002D21A921|nr:STAS domain-containing protein [Streptomyces sp. NRRL F-5755]
MAVRLPALRCHRDPRSARGRLTAAMDAAESAVLLDLRPATFFDCSGLRLLLFAYLHIRRGRLRVVGDHVPTLRLLHVTGIAPVLRPTPTIAGALTALAADGASAGRRSGR